jgi:hypothetical protein
MVMLCPRSLYLKRMENTQRSLKEFMDELKLMSFGESEKERKRGSLVRRKCFSFK